MKKLITLFLIFSTAASGAPTVGTTQVQMFRSSERNYVKNTSARLNTDGVNTSSATKARVTTAGNKIDGFASFTCDTSANGGYCEWTTDTIEDGDKTGSCWATGQIKGDGTLYSAQVFDGTNVVNTVPLGNATDWTPFEVTYPCGATRTVRITQTTAGTSPALGVAKVYYGKNTGLGSVPSLSKYSAATLTSTGIGTTTLQSTWVRQVGDSAEFRGYMKAGTVSAVAASLGLPAGYVMDATKFASTSGVQMVGKFQRIETGAGGTFAVTQQGPIFYDGSDTANLYLSIASGSNALTKTLGSTIFNSSDGVTFYFTVPIVAFQANDTVFRTNVPRYPTITKLTSGSGTYTPPANVTYIRVKLAGGGGGGSGSLSGAGGAGGNTSFTDGTITLQGNAGGGAAAAGNGGAGGTVSNTITGDVSVIVAQDGPDGGGSAWFAGDSQGRGGDGGSTPFAGAGLGGGNGAGSGPGKAAKANTGSGGGGGATRVTANNHGAGGGAGGYVEALIRNPKSFTYSIGTGGTGGTGAAGTAGAANGGAGGTGVVIVEEFYGNSTPWINSAPTVQKFTSGSGTYNTPAGVRYIKVRMIGAGGGGGGSSTANNGGTGGTGGNTTFGSSLLTANGGTGPATGSFSTGGTATVSAPAIELVALTGGPGASYNQASAGTYLPGGHGAPSPFGGGGNSRPLASGVAATNYGTGGGGGGGQNTGGGNSGSGGAAGGYIEALISAPSTSYAYSIGTGGTGGAAGTSGFVGGAGAGGYIEVTEFYQ